MNYGGGSVVNIGAMTNHPVQIMSNNQTILRVDTSGLSFDGGSNYLNDYEEGTWTPNISTGGASPTYSVQSGYYVKVGNLVDFAFQINISGGSFGSGNFIIGGLPFTPNATYTYGRYPIQTSSVNFEGTAYDMYAYVSGGNLQVLYSFDNGGWSVATTTNFVIQNGSIITCRGTYTT